MKVNKASTFKYIKDAPSYQLEMMRAGHEINLISLFGTKIYLFYNQEAVKEVLLTKAKSFNKGMALNNAKALIGNNILSSDGEDHIKRRKDLSKVFSKTFITRFEFEINDLMSKQVKNLDGIEINVEEFFTKISMDIISVLLFGQKLEKKMKIIDKSLQDALKLIAYMSIPGYKKLLWLPLPHHLKYRKAISNIQKISSDLVKSHSKKENNGAIGILINAGCTHDEINDQMLALFLAGHETTATVLTWIFYVSTKENLISEELLESISICYNENILYENLESQPIVKAFIYEMLRLYPPVWNIGRKVIEDVEISGVKLKAGDYLSLSPYTSQRNENNFHNAEKFNLHRWLDSEGKIIKANQFAYFPFSLGTRNCIGKILAETEIYTIIKHFFYHYDFELVSKADVKSKGLITLKPDREIKIKINKRSKI
jgi:cytochrome P450